MNFLSKYFETKIEKEHLIVTSKILGGKSVRIGLYHLPRKKIPAVVIYDPGGFGDYIVARPFFKYLKEYYKNYKIIFLCKDWFSDFSKIYDQNVIDIVIPLNVVEFKSNKAYRKNLIKYINATYKIKNVIPLASFGLGAGGLLKYRLTIAKKLNSKEKTIFYKKHKETKDRRLNIFNRKIEIEKGLFYTEVYRRMFEYLTKIKIPKDISVKIPLDCKKERKHIGVQLRASTEWKSYPVSKWLVILKHILKVTDEDTKLIFLGGREDCPYVSEVISKLNCPNRCVDFSNNVVPSTLPLIMSEFKLYLSLDTGNTHLAHALDCPTLALFGGHYYKTVFPYENSSIEYICSPRFYEIINGNDEEKIKELSKGDTCGCLVKDIDPYSVIELADKKLNSVLTKN